MLLVSAAPAMADGGRGHGHRDCHNVKHHHNGHARAYHDNYRRPRGLLWQAPAVVEYRVQPRYRTTVVVPVPVPVQPQYYGGSGYYNATANFGSSGGAVFGFSIGGSYY